MCRPSFQLADRALALPLIHGAGQALAAGSSAGTPGGMFSPLGWQGLFLAVVSLWCLTR